MKKFVLILVSFQAFYLFDSVCSQQYDWLCAEITGYPVIKNEAGAYICEQSGMTCTSNNQCCSGKCNEEKNKCVCKSRLKFCCFDEQCCSGNCTWKDEDILKTCRCSRLGSSCRDNSDCCPELNAVCIDDLCFACSTSGSNCSSNTECCSGSDCLGNQCI